MDVGLQTYRNNAEQENRDQLVLSHLTYVKKIIGRMRSEFPDEIDIENLESAGILGLVEAASRFNSDLGVQFTTFAYQRIRGAILDELRRNCPLPQSTLQHWAMIRDVWHQLGERPTSLSIAAATGLSVDEVEACLAAIRMTRPEVWREELPIRRECDASADAVYSEKEQIRRLTDAIEKISDRARTAITLYHLNQLTLKEIGTVMRLSESRVSRILAASELELKGLLLSTNIDQQVSSN
ncbi:RNA polymerase sigma factor FliA [Thalassoglobus neptunius]|uniref:RNA polymerase sigma factor FliA n=1 Tax=Thalassoglobus neptunius TaxID=1938619 RepID=A0A5C5VZ38_9PLAN|nr:sigma-70 family RNA polymerase sigma factor [Thalassoglobus neptunius]TWT43029.1 RNA polymerase sigma factor FliA [Thalassoglobus neptunius]